LPFPSKYVSIRGSTDEEKYVAVDITRIVQVGSGFHVLEEIDLSRALFEIYEGAVVSHQMITHWPRSVDAGLVRFEVYSPGSHLRCEFFVMT